MHADFWLQRWLQGQIGLHQKAGNPQPRGLWRQPRVHEALDEAPNLRPRGLSRLAGEVFPLTPAVRP